jgi:hypothetical protein
MRSRERERESKSEDPDGLVEELGVSDRCRNFKDFADDSCGQLDLLHDDPLHQRGDDLFRERQRERERKRETERERTVSHSSAGETH